MSRSARSEILGRIRAAQRAGPGVVTVPREYHKPGVMTDKDLAALLAGRLADYGALVRRTPAAAAPAAIAAALSERGAQRVAAPADLPAEWAAALPQPLFDGPELNLAEAVRSGRRDHRSCGRNRADRHPDPRSWPGPGAQGTLARPGCSSRGGSG